MWGNSADPGLEVSPMLGVHLSDNPYTYTNITTTLIPNATNITTTTMKHESHLAGTHVGSGMD